MSQPSSPVAVFVYGTLKQGQRNFEVSRRAGWVRSERAWLEGFQIYHLPRASERPYSYPAIVAGEGRVWGEVQYFADLEAALVPLDALEDAGREYERVEVEARRPDGGAVRVWTYVYPSLEAVRRVNGVLCPGGDWSDPA
ncbi:Gamma-glutamylcyclotransferase family protein YtfP [Calidithermus terrae]|uniref:Gamma-glutamylcyclotransferase family protein YtfP n=1 Tax=Calidithermus terrae TaxID=1408545 RepID=A0A399DZV9_9DEIN|nr:gamma-glutamylcyclotransferase family protein [Calidithermus terrae]RIH77837.1 Gamma-glutamylcyclotransferase family protein YtfP [Calidithermus terrae]